MGRALQQYALVVIEQYQTDRQLTFFEGKRMVNKELGMEDFRKECINDFDASGRQWKTGN